MRLIEMDIEPFLLRSSLIAVVAQRLMRRLCPHCKKEFRPDETLMAQLKEQWPDIEQHTLAEPGG
jgi:type II secretory ATPase GspE/PulE/Tfp pilus assembly ATPase PilB-like protein